MEAASKGIGFHEYVQQWVQGRDILWGGGVSIGIVRRA